MNNETLKIVIDKIKENIQAVMGDKLVKCFLYGSCARGDWGELSNINICALIDTDRTEINEYLYKGIDFSTDLDLSYFVVTEIITILF